LRAPTNSPAGSIRDERRLSGDKSGNDRWYDEQVPLADTLYDDYLQN
jgi:hypothetical protein